MGIKLFLMFNLKFRDEWKYQNGCFFGKVPKGGGSFPIQKFILQIFAIINGTLVMNSGKNLQYNFPKTRGGGGSKAIWNFSEKTSVLVFPIVPK